MNHDHMREYKGYQVKPSKETPNCYIVVTAGKGGKAPDCLTGMFTSRAIAHMEIDRYLENKPKKDNNNAENSETGGSK